MAQDPKSGMQEKMRAQHSTRMENLELNQDSEKTERDSSLIGAQDPKSGMQEKMRAQHSTRMENLELNQDSEKTDRDSSLIGAQDPKSGMQERMRAQPSSRMEKFSQTDHHEQDQNPGTKRTETKAAGFFLTELQDPGSGPKIQKVMRDESSTRLEKPKQTRPTTITKETKIHLAA